MCVIQVTLISVSTICTLCAAAEQVRIIFQNKLTWIGRARKEHTLILEYFLMKNLQKVAKMVKDLYIIDTRTLVNTAMSKAFREKGYEVTVRIFLVLYFCFSKISRQSV